MGYSQEKGDKDEPRKRSRDREKHHSRERSRSRERDPRREKDTDKEKDRGRDRRRRSRSRERRSEKRDKRSRSSRKDPPPPPPTSSSSYASMPKIAFQKAIEREVCCTSHPWYRSSLIDHAYAQHTRAGSSANPEKTDASPFLHTSTLYNMARSDEQEKRMDQHIYVCP